MPDKTEFKELLNNVKAAYMPHNPIVYTSHHSASYGIKWSWKTDRWAFAIRECMMCFENSCEEENPAYLYNSLANLDWPSRKVFPLNNDLKQLDQVRLIMKLLDIWGRAIRFNADAHCQGGSYEVIISLEEKAVRNFTEIEEEIYMIINANFREAVRAALQNQMLRILVRDANSLDVLTKKVIHYEKLGGDGYKIEYNVLSPIMELNQILVEVQNSFGQSSYDFIYIKGAQSK